MDTVSYMLVWGNDRTPTPYTRYEWRGMGKIRMTFNNGHGPFGALPQSTRESFGW